MNGAKHSDEALKAHLDSLSYGDKEYWSFRGKAVREHAHAYFQYPAMMVPRMQGDLINAVLKVDPSCQTAFDPFVGSGTILTEAMSQGLNFLGYDINPLAVLLCRAKAGPFYLNRIQDDLTEILALIKQDRSSKREASFPGQNKWFRNDTVIALSKIRRAIRARPALWSRRFFWVVLAETVRLTSNSRTSTFKLHVCPRNEIDARDISPLAVFEDIANRNIGKLGSQKRLLQERGLLKNGKYRGDISIRLQNSNEATPPHDNRSDFLVTSPPYGDNQSTVPYGQYSYLPLQWIDWNDIDEKMDASWMASTHEIDHRSLGGSLVGGFESQKELGNLSESLRRTFLALQHKPRDRIVRVAAFCRDLNRCLGPILAMLKPNAYMVWTVGNRRVGNRPVPVDAILGELLAARGATLVAQIDRRIPSKRMAVKNNITATMRAETVLIVRK